MDHHSHQLPAAGGRRRAGLALAIGILVGTVGVATTAGPPVASFASGSSAAAHRAVDCAQPGPYQLPQGSDPIVLEPADFTARIDNPYWPMRPGTIWRYTERSQGQVVQVRVLVTHRTRLIQGVRARVVHDSARSHGQLVEDTHDWYAQDSGGSIWYLGELSKSYENGHVASTEGSWEHGRDGAFAGVVVPAEPLPGCGYREEFRNGVAEDHAAILARTEPLRGPTGFHRHVLHTSNTSPLEPSALENKFYARGVGPVLEIDVSPRLGTAVLTSISRGH